MLSQTTDTIRNFIQQELLFEEPGVTVADDAKLLEGMVDSLGLLQLVAFLESEFEVQIDEADINVANFETVAAIAALIDRSRN